jgi:hypothetical protein
MEAFIVCEIILDTQKKNKKKIAENLWAARL